MNRAGINSIEVNVDGLPAGFYFCSIVTGYTIVSKKVTIID